MNSSMLSDELRDALAYRERMRAWCLSQATTRYGVVEGEKHAGDFWCSEPTDARIATLMLACAMFPTESRT